MRRIANAEHKKGCWLLASGRNRKLEGAMGRGNEGAMVPNPMKVKLQSDLADIEI